MACLEDPNSSLSVASSHAASPALCPTASSKSERGSHILGQSRLGFQPLEEVFFPPRARCLPRCEARKSHPSLPRGPALRQVFSPRPTRRHGGFLFNTSDKALLKRGESKHLREAAMEPFVTVVGHTRVPARVHPVLEPSAGTRAVLRLCPARGLGTGHAHPQHLARASAGTCYLFLMTTSATRGRHTWGLDQSNLERRGPSSHLELHQSR